MKKSLQLKIITLLSFSPASVERFDVSKKRIRTLHINPTQTDEFCVSGLDEYD